MPEKIETRCWDCPNQKSFARFRGRVAMRWRKMTNVFECDPEGAQRKEAACPGRVAGALWTTFETGFPEANGQITETSEETTIYLATCPKELPELEDKYSDVTQILRNNNMLSFVEKTVESGEAVPADEWRAAREARFEEIG